MRNVLSTAGAATLAMFLASGAQAQTSSFSASAEGWTALGDVAGPLTWLATGGNPGGRVQITDATTGGVTYFVAPVSFLGDKSSAVGTNLTFDLQQVYSGRADQFDASDVLLIGGGLTLAYDTAANPANGSWTSYAVPLTAGGWHLNTPTGAAVSSAQFLNVMSNLTALRIRAEYQTGADTDYLDNVSLASAVSPPVPEPETYALMLLGIGTLACAVRLRRRSAAARVA